MSLLTNLFKLVGPTLTNGYCPATFQQLADDFFNGAQVTFLIDTGNFLYNYGTATPAPENRIFPWLNTDDGLWWNFKFGLWVSPVPYRDLQVGFRQMYLPDAGTPESTVWALEGGSGLDPSISIPTDTTGAFWKVDHTMDGRFPLGAGEIPDSDLGTGAASVAIAQTTDTFGRSGEYAHLLKEDEGAVGNHIHPLGVCDPLSDDGVFNIVNAAVTVGPYQGHDIVGGGSQTAPAETTANLYTLKAADNAGVVAVKHNTMPGYRAVWWLAHTQRRYYTRAA